ncbi:MAG: hypothetical protein ACTSXA_07145 [Candidatus Heimdallarchaeota archaeon]
MNQDNTQALKFIKVAFLAFAALFSLVAAILVFFFEYGGWWLGGGYSNYYYWIGSEMAPVWSQLFLVLLGLLFLALLALSVILGILILTDKGEKMVKILGFVGIGGAIFGFLLTFITWGMFAIIAGDYYELWLMTGFYGALVGSLLIGIFYLLYAVIGFLIKPSETTAK